MKINLKFIKRKEVIKYHKAFERYHLYYVYYIFGIAIKKEYRRTLTKYEATNYINSMHNVVTDVKYDK